MHKPIPSIPVIYYHSIGPVNDHWNRNFLTLEPEFFEDQLRYIASHFESVFLKEYWNMRTGQSPFRPEALVITLDDGFLDNWVWAYPLLKKYGLRATLFVNPEMVDPRDILRPNLDDAIRLQQNPADLECRGYASWPELRAMINSGWIEVQSHTMTHTRYTISERLIGFHAPDKDCLYAVGNLFPERKPFHITDPDFEKLLPYGYPLFESASSVIARRLFINPEFSRACVNRLKGSDLSSRSFPELFNEVEAIYGQFRQQNRLIVHRESEREYRERLHYEIAESKRVLEAHLNRPVEFLCWPHGDQNRDAHDLAMECGYLATTTGSSQLPDSSDRIPARLGLGRVGHNRFLSVLKARYKLGSARRQFPYAQIEQVYHRIRHGKAISANAGLVP